MSLDQNCYSAGVWGRPITAPTLLKLLSEHLILELSTLGSSGGGALVVHCRLHQHQAKDQLHQGKMDTSLTLSSGAKMPLLGLGTWKSKPGEVEAAVEHALRWESWFLFDYLHCRCSSSHSMQSILGIQYGPVT